MKGLFQWVGPAILTTTLLCSSGATEGLSLKQAIETAQMNNPAVSAAQLSAQAAAHSAIGAKALTNPEIVVAPTIVGTAGSDSVAFISQPLEINGSRKVRTQIAAQEAASARYDAVATARDITLKVTQTYWDVAKAQGLVDLGKENVQNVEALDAAAKRQVEVGTVPEAVEIKTRVEVARAEQELALAQLELSQAKSTLNSLMNRPNVDFATTDAITFSPISVDAAALETTAVSMRPEVASATVLAAAAKREIEAARIQQRPDLAIQARKESWDGEGGVAVAVSLPLLDWGSVKQDKNRAMLKAQSQAKQLEATKNNVSLEVQQALNSVQTSAAIVKQYESGLLAESEQLVRIAQKGYEKGATSYLEVLEAQRTMRSVKSAYLSAIADHAKAVAQLEWATCTNATGVAVSEVSK